jgi:uncharacterized membrane protein YkvA (DUF1232 family)
MNGNDLVKPFLKLSDRVREKQLLSKAKALAKKLPLARDAVAMWFAVRDPKTPFALKATLLIAIGYFVMPFDVIPDFLLGLGYTDDAAVIIAALRAAEGMMKEQHYLQADEALSDEATV